MTDRRFTLASLAPLAAALSLMVAVPGAAAKDPPKGSVPAGAASATKATSVAAHSVRMAAGRSAQRAGSRIGAVFMMTGILEARL